MSGIADYSVGSLSEFYTRTAIPNAPVHSGRLPLTKSEEKWEVPRAQLFAPEPHLEPTRVAERVFYRHEDTPLNMLYFSQANIDAVQDKLRSAVLAMSSGKYSIDRQSEEDLKTVMRSYYLTYAKNNPLRVAQELEELNERVVGFSANRIMVEIEAYKYYRKDIMDFPDPIQRPIDTHKKGSNMSELKSFF